MKSLKAIAVTLSVLVHGSLGYALVAVPDRLVMDAFNTGTGDETVLVEQGIAIEGLAKLGDEIATLETADVPPVEQNTPPPIEDLKPIDELRDAITATDSRVEDQIVKTEEPPPLAEPPKPQQVQVEVPPQQTAKASQQSSGDARAGGSTTARTAYLGRLRDVLEKAKINPRTRLAGTVVVKFRVAAGGQLVSREITTSSGSKVLDDAAVAVLERAAPFPPMPAGVASGEPMVVTVPFEFNHPRKRQ
jgi:periplasmic protein TonB